MIKINKKKMFFLNCIVNCIVLSRPDLICKQTREVKKKSLPAKINEQLSQSWDSCPNQGIGISKSQSTKLEDIGIKNQEMNKVKRSIIFLDNFS